MSEFKFVKINKKGVITVLTPNPYKVTAYVSIYEKSLTDENIRTELYGNVLYGLDQSCKFLYDCLRLLGISKKEAKEQNYTLNKATGDKFWSLLNQREISFQFKQIINNYNW